MIRPLRDRHRVAWLLLAVALPVLYALALWLRPAMPVMEEIPAALVGDAYEVAEP